MIVDYVLVPSAAFVLSTFACVCLGFAGVGTWLCLAAFAAIPGGSMVSKSCRAYAKWRACNFGFVGALISICGLFFHG